MAKMLTENETAFHQTMQSDFKTASQEYLFETYACIGEVMYQKSQLPQWIAPEEAPVPKPLAATGHKGMVYRDPFGVALIIVAADDHHARFDLAVRIERRFAVAPAFDRSNVFVDAEFCHRNSSVV
jgi:hypothetical protein